MYLPSDKRYDKMIYSRCGRSGLKPVSYTHLTLPTNSLV